MENKQLRDQFDRCQNGYDNFVLSTRPIVLAENRTIERMRICKTKALEMQHELKNFIKVIEGIAGFIDYPLY